MKRILTWFALCAIALVILGNLWIELRAHDRIFTDAGKIPANRVGLVLGTSSKHGGNENPFFAGRIAAAVELYRAGKVRHLLLSGDNHIAGYDEPADMRDALVKLGVPEQALTLDDAGFRTLDSFARAKAVFGIDRFTIVTDDFHAARSLLLARHFGIDAVAFTSKPVPLKWSGKTRAREMIARCKALLDLYLLRTAPHFLGPKIGLPSD